MSNFGSHIQGHYVDSKFSFDCQANIGVVHFRSVLVFLVDVENENLFETMGVIKVLFKKPLQIFLPQF